MDWDQTLEKLRREVFRPTIPPPVRLPTWAAAALLGAGLTLAAPACDRGAGDAPGASDMGRVNVEYGAPMPPDMADAPPPTDVKPLYAGPPPDVVRPVEPPPPVEEYRAPIMREPEPAPMDEAMTATPPDGPRETPLYSMAVAPRPRDSIGEAKPMYGIPPHLRPENPPMPPPDRKLYAAPPADE